MFCMVSHLLWQKPVLFCHSCWTISVVKQKLQKLLWQWYLLSYPKWWTKFPPYEVFARLLPLFITYWLWRLASLYCQHFWSTGVLCRPLLITMKHELCQTMSTVIAKGFSAARKFCIQDIRTTMVGSSSGICSRELSLTVRELPENSTMECFEAAIIVNLQFTLSHMGDAILFRLFLYIF